MDLADFDALFEALTGREPYPWQRRLYRRFTDRDAGGSVPEALDLPTGLGKTSVMAIWLAARINGAGLARRLIYVVDRRAVVDQATQEAEDLARALDGLIAGEHGALISQRLGLSLERSTGEGRKGSLLPISTLRGQYLDNRRWLDDPAAAAIVVGTVDMIGSRLLFGGYGVSPWMRPVHAAMIGVDSLVVLDEAHLTPPFEAMLRGAAVLVAEDVACAPDGPQALRPLRVMSLSATGGERPGAEVFRLDDEDRDDPRTALRLNAPKRVRLQGEVAAGKLAETLAALAWGLGAEGLGAEGLGADGVGAGGASARRVIVFCNSRRTAQEVAAILDKRVTSKDAYGKGARLTALLVGERRYAERAELADSAVFRRFMAGAAAGDDARPAFLVATSAGEVGVDLDADDLVCDLVAWERMVQRLGRVNRRATPGEARVLVVPVSGDKEAEDAIDDPRLKALLKPFACEAWDRGPDGALDGSPAGLLALKRAAGAVLEAASTTAPLHPPLTRPVVEAWSLTSLKAHPGRPKLEPWLRGWVDADPQTRVVWRRWLPIRKGDTRVTPELETYLEEVARPHVSEALEAPAWRVAEMLRDRAKAWLKGAPDVFAEALDHDLAAADGPDEVAPANDAEAPSLAPAYRPVVVRLSGDGTVEHVYDLRSLEGGKAEALARDIAFGTVVVDARLGGLDGAGLLSGKAPGPVRTADDQPWPTDALQTTTGWRVQVAQRPSSSGGDASGRWVLSKFRWSLGEGDDAPALWVEFWRGAGRNPGDPAIAGRPQALADHLADTGCQAARIAQGLGLAGPHPAVLVAAARAHDLGKDRRLWQDAMGAARSGRPYAKTVGGGDGRALNGYRHEFGSLHDVLAAPDTYLAQAGVSDEDMADLALHLIGAHHGRCRPSVAAYDPDHPIAPSAILAQEAAMRFARLQARWGPWGLAWWEALLRAADRAASSALNARVDEPRAEAPEPVAGEAAHG